MKRLLPILMTLCCILMSCGESKQDYNKRIGAFADSVMKEAGPNITVASTRTRVWNNAIFDNRMSDPMTGEQTAEFCFDFNLALQAFNSSDFIQSVKEARVAGKKQLDSLYATVKEAPSGAEQTLSSAKDLYSTYMKSYALAWEPEGSLQTYRQSVSDTRDKLKELNDKVQLDAK